MIRTLSKIAALLSWLLVPAVVTGCSGPSSPSPQPSPGPMIACPAPVSVQSADGRDVQVALEGPTTSGGALPVVTTCTSASGATFPIGTTTVTCSATDTQLRSASCNFTITVAAPPTLRATRFLSFGDSITEGKLGPCSNQDLHSASPYPSALQMLLANRYTTQSPIVVNAGAGGENVTDATTVGRLGTQLVSHPSDVLLLQEGINDVNFALGTPAQIVDGLRQLVREGHRHGAQVFLGTLLPERPGSCRARAVDAVAPMNDQIRAMGIAEGAVVVDLYDPFTTQLNVLIGDDGLHPNDAGYARMAEIFFARVREQLENTPAILSSRVARLGFHIHG
jgi:lysophospholipase L1-like esterase